MKCASSEAYFFSLCLTPANPPYQERTTDEGVQAKPIYHLFVSEAKKIRPNYLSMITPSRWFAGGMGLDSFRTEMATDHGIVKMVDFTNSKDCFPNISISGGVSYFLWDINKSEDNTEFIGIHAGIKTNMVRSLNEFPVVVRYNAAVSILRKIYAKHERSLSQIASAISPYALSTKIRGADQPSEENKIRLFTSKGISYISEEDLVKKDDSIQSYRVLLSQTSAEHAGEPSSNGQFNVFTKTMQTMVPGDVCTHSYIYLGTYTEKSYADNLLSYLKTKFVRALVLQALSSIHISKTTFSFVPVQDFSKPWTDAELYAKYGLTEDEIAFIEGTIRAME